MEENPGLMLAIKLVPVALLLIWLAGIIDILRRRDLPVNERTLWFFVVLFLPLIGYFIYAFIGPSRPTTPKFFK